jgi:hypothetical protein
MYSSILEILLSGTPDIYNTPPTSLPVITLSASMIVLPPIATPLRINVFYPIKPLLFIDTLLEEPYNNPGFLGNDLIPIILEDRKLPII